MEGFTNGGQLHELFLSAGAGFLLAAAYDLVRILRRIWPCGRTAAFFQDVGFCLLGGITLFLFDLALTGGRLRFYLFVGAALGGGVYFAAISRWVIRLAMRIAAVLETVAGAMARVICLPFGWLGRLLRPLAAVFAEKSRIFLKKGRLFFKKGLQRGRKLLYNHNRKSVYETQTAEGSDGHEGDQRHEKTPQHRAAGGRSDLFGVYAGDAGAAAHGDRRAAKAARRDRGQHPLPAAAKRRHGQQNREL